MVHGFMLIPSLRRQILIVILGVGLLTTPFLQVALGAGISVEVPASVCDRQAVDGGCCDCCDPCHALAGLGHCLALCFTAYTLPAAALSNDPSQVRSARRLLRDNWAQRLNSPEPDPPKQTIFL